MSEELERQIIPRGPGAPPRVELLSGQYLFCIPASPEGGVKEKIVSAAAMREAVLGITVDSGWMPPSVRRWGTGLDGDWAVMFVPPGRHAVEFMTDDTSVPGGVERLELVLPGIVLFGSGVKYYVWAVKTPDLQPYQEIYRCPLPNVEPDAAICYGGHKPPRCTATTILQAWEIFMRTPFNNHRCDGKSKRDAEDVRAVLRETAAAGDAAVYPVEDLVRQVPGTGVTLDKAIRTFFDEREMPGA